MIVVGTYGESPITGIFLGSTAYKLVHATTKRCSMPPAKRRKAA